MTCVLADPALADVVVVRDQALVEDRPRDPTLDVARIAERRHAEEQRRFGEDIHWADPTTVQFIGSLVGVSATGPLVVTMTARPEFAAPSDSSAVTACDLGRLGPMQTAAVAESVTEGVSLSRAAVAAIVAQTIDEYTRALLETGGLRLVGSVTS